MKRILIVDDDVNILELIKNILEPENLYELTFVSQVETIKDEDYYGYDLIILDIMLGMSITGIDICRKIRAKLSCPILFLTAKTGEDDLVEGFTVGADDYIKKPFSPVELKIRIAAHLNRDMRKESTTERYENIGGVHFQRDLKMIYVNGEEVALTNLEYKIMELLAFNRSKIFSVEEIYFKVYGTDSDSLFRNVSEHVYQIRQKFKVHNMNPIKTVWGIGYKWQE